MNYLGQIQVKGGRQLLSGAASGHASSCKNSWSSISYLAVLPWLGHSGGYHSSYGTRGSICSLCPEKRSYMELLTEGNFASD